MNRLGFVLALGAAILTGLAFGLWPDRDVQIAGMFFDSGRGFSWSRQPLLASLRDAAMWIAAAFIVLAAISLLARMLRGQRRLWLSGRAAVFLIVTMVAGPGLLVNVVLKDHWHRPRPVQITAFGGQSAFVPWWNPTGSCERNCSFVAGEAAGAFWTLAPAVLVPPPWRSLATLAALGFGLAVGLLRMSFGAHFASDVLFAGFAMFFVIWTAHGYFFRWRGAAAREQMIELFLAACGRRLSGNLARPGTVADQKRSTEGASAAPTPLSSLPGSAER